MVGCGCYTYSLNQNQQC
uniref:Uncharacterized protein n=1 Tax=Anguilla anguilla TaxID=7936 RepID=A0A0E9VI51_ANGAN